MKKLQKIIKVATYISMPFAIIIAVFATWQKAKGIEPHPNLMLAGNILVPLPIILFLTILALLIIEAIIEVKEEKSKK